MMILDNFYKGHVMEYEMSEEQFETLMDASKPVVCMKIGNVQPRSIQENANRAWKQLGNEMGFDHFTVAPVAGKSDRFFTAKKRFDPTR